MGNNYSLSCTCFFFLLNCESFFIIFMMMKIDIQNDCEKFNYMVR